MEGPSSARSGQAWPGLLVVGWPCPGSVRRSGCAGRVNVGGAGRILAPWSRQLVERGEHDMTCLEGGCAVDSSLQLRLG